ncbi:MAG: helix-turn-helix transcriptional regulator [bacterium]|nr:helix-turn-helix transcriptional regulator [bacterium]
MKRKKPVFLLISLSLLLLSACVNKDSIPVKNWEILYDEDPSQRAVAQKKGWKPISVPFRFDLPASGENRFHFTWLKGEFTITGDTSRYYGVTTGRIKFSDTVIINNITIASHPPEKVHPMPLQRSYPLNSSICERKILRQGKNEIYIRLGSYGDESFNLAGNVYIQPEEEFELSRLIYEFLYKQVPVGITGLYTSLVLIILILYLFNRKERLLLFNGLTGLNFVIYFLTLYIPFRYISPELSSSIKWASIPIIGALLILMIQATYKIYYNTLNRIIIPILLCLAVSISILRYGYAAYNAASILVLINYIIFIPLLLFFLYRLHSTAGDRFLFFMMLILLSVSAVTVTGEVAAALSGGAYSDLFIIYLAPLGAFIFTTIWGRETMKSKMELEQLYDTLKKEQESQKENQKEPAITGITEKKLKKVIDFVNENYTSDLAREGLAAAIDMNPNYMSRLFKTYTGKKISEYINELRVREAARMLKETDERIIDIALSVGFESLTTFNRSFKNIIGRTPTEYRVYHIVL